MWDGAAVTSETDGERDSLVGDGIVDESLVPTFYSLPTYTRPLREGGDGSVEGRPTTSKKRQNVKHLRRQVTVNRQEILVKFSK